MRSTYRSIHRNISQRQLGNARKDFDDLIQEESGRNLFLQQLGYLNENGELTEAAYRVGFTTREEIISAFAEALNYEVNTDAILASANQFAKNALRTLFNNIEADGIAVSPYCSLPSDLDRWIKAYQKAVAICGHSAQSKVVSPRKEVTYLDALVRGVYARWDLPKGHKLTDEDVYLAIPLQKGQISCRELMRGEVLLTDIKKDSPIKIDDINSPYSKNQDLKKLIYERGL